MSIAVMCSGGDAPGMNPAIKQFVDYVLSIKLTPYLIFDGLEGLIDGKIKPCSYEDVAGIMHEGGSKIRSSRSKRFFDKKYRQLAYENLQKYNIDKIVVLGGDGSFRAMNVFYEEFGVNFVGIPTTIDNDIYGTDYCLGVDTALNTIRQATDAIRDTSASFKRACVVETMGRDCGYLALVTAITCGAEICVIPEIEFNLEDIKNRLKKEVENGRTYVVCIVAEGTGMTYKMVDWLESEIGMETRATILGHIQRGGNPTVFDRLMAVEFVTNAIEKLLNDKGGFVIVYKDSNFDFVTIDYVNSGTYKIKNQLIELAKRLYQ